MKKFIYTITALVAFAVSANAQVGIETNDVSNKAILDFPDNADGGILLPYVTSPNTAGNTPGTLLYNATDGNVYLQDKNNNWVELSKAPKNSAKIAKHDIANYPEKNAEGILISDTGNDTAKGALVLKSNNKALALPKVNGVESILSPKPGMICYDKNRKALAIFNGEKWILRN